MTQFKKLCSKRVLVFPPCGAQDCLPAVCTHCSWFCPWKSDPFLHKQPSKYSDVTIAQFKVFSFIFQEAENRLI